VASGIADDGLAHPVRLVERSVEDVGGSHRPITALSPPYHHGVNACRGDERHCRYIASRLSCHRCTNTYEPHALAPAATLPLDPTAALGSLELQRPLRSPLWLAGSKSAWAAADGASMM
jgi:hypothetical protein